MTTSRRIRLSRKKGWRLLAALGPAGLLGLLRLRSLGQTMQSLSLRLDLDLRAVEMRNPLAAVDVDKPADHELVEAIFAGRA
jgi:hypothetical protein